MSSCYVVTHLLILLPLGTIPFPLLLPGTTISFFPCFLLLTVYFCPVQQFVSFLACFLSHTTTICFYFISVPCNNLFLSLLSTPRNNLFVFHLLPSHTTICFYFISSATHTTIPILAPRDSNFHSAPAQQFLFYFCPLTTTATPILQRYPFHFFPHTLFPFCPRAAISILFLSSHIICTHFLSPHNNVHPSFVPVQQFSYHFPLTRPTSTRDTTHVTHITTTHTICSITNTCAQP